MAVKDVYVDLDTWIDQVQKIEDFTLASYLTSVFVNISKMDPEVQNSKFMKYPYTISFLESQIRNSRPTKEEFAEDVNRIIEYVKSKLSESDDEVQDLFSDLCNKDLEDCTLGDLSVITTYNKERTSFLTAFPINEHMPIFIRGYNFKNYWMTRIDPFSDTRLSNQVYDEIQNMPVIANTRRTIAIPYKKEDNVIAIRRPELGIDAFALFIDRKTPAEFTEDFPNFLGNTKGTDKEIMKFISDINNEIFNEESTIYPFELDE